MKVFDEFITKPDIKNLKNQKHNYQALVIDDPTTTFEYQKKLKDFFNNVILFQDIPKKNFCDILVNHNIILNSKKKYQKLSKKKLDFYLVKNI